LPTFATLISSVTQAQDRQTEREREREAIIEITKIWHNEEFRNMYGMWKVTSVIEIQTMKLEIRLAHDEE
jgi:hypothetical protein